MEKIKQAWTYCAIDAPEDTHGTLKEQFRRLCDYAEQMEFEAVGSSSDCGGRPLMNRPGFRHFIERRREKSNVLLVVNRNSLFCSYTAGTDTGYGRISNVEIWSPQEGRIF